MKKAYIESKYIEIQKHITTNPIKADIINSKNAFSILSLLALENYINKLAAKYVVNVTVPFIIILNILITNFILIANCILKNSYAFNYLEV
jgi:hypothetical protein